MFLFHRERLTHAARALGTATRACVTQPSDFPGVGRKRMRGEVDTWHSAACWTWPPPGSPSAVLARRRTFRRPSLQLEPFLFHSSGFYGCVHMPLHCTYSPGDLLNKYGVHFVRAETRRNIWCGRDDWAANASLGYNQLQASLVLTQFGSRCSQFH